MADLNYEIVAKQLMGSLDGEKINAIAYSGGRAGTKRPGAENQFLANNPFATTKKKNEKIETDIGGPLPVGLYVLKAHESRPNWIKLIPSQSNCMFGRDEFGIHGRGPRGSDGYIVPADFQVVLKILKLVKHRANQKKPPYTLQVKGVAIVDYFHGIITNCFNN